MPAGIYNPYPNNALTYTGTAGYSGGGNPFGTKVAPIPMPNPGADLAGAFPNLAGTNAALSTDINAQLGGKLSPGTLAAMQDYEASFAAGSGMPGSNAIPGTLGYNRGVRDIGTTAEAQVRAGEAAYNSTIPTISRTQTVDPATQAMVNEENAINLSAPDPAAAASYAEQLFNKYLNALRGPGGGSGGGTHPIGGGGTGNYASVKGMPSLSAPATSGFDSATDFGGNDRTYYSRNSIGMGGGGGSVGEGGGLFSPFTQERWLNQILPPNAGYAPIGNPQSHELSNDDMFGGLWDTQTALDEMGI